jgi:hypothetical protein
MSTPSPLNTIPYNPENPRVFFDITIGNESTGRIVMELFKDVAPKTVGKYINKIKQYQKYLNDSNILIHTTFILNILFFSFHLFCLYLFRKFSCIMYW